MLNKVYFVYKTLLLIDAQFNDSIVIVHNLSTGERRYVRDLSDAGGKIGFIYTSENSSRLTLFEFIEKLENYVDTECSGYRIPFVGVEDERRHYLIYYI
jgi:hypothetical protein